MTSTAIGFLMVAALLSTWTVSLNEFILTEWAPGGRVRTNHSIKSPALRDCCVVPVSSTHRKHDVNYPTTTRSNGPRETEQQQQVLRDVIDPADTDGGKEQQPRRRNWCVSSHLFSRQRKKRQNKMPQGQYQLPRLIDPSWRHSLSLSLSIIIIIIPSSFCQCPSVENAAVQINRAQWFASAMLYFIDFYPFPALFSFSLYAAKIVDNLLFGSCVIILFAAAEEEEEDTWGKLDGQHHLAGESIHCCRH